MPGRRNPHRSLFGAQCLSHEVDSGSFYGRVASDLPLLAFTLARSDREGCSLLARLASTIKSRETVLENLPIRIGQIAWVRFPALVFARTRILAESQELLNLLYTAHVYHYYDIDDLPGNA
jgi:hypothetical protein